MNWWQAFILGLVEGVTEYLPISSTFHLIWAARLMGLEQTGFLKLFEVVIQGGAIAAVAVLYWGVLVKEKGLLGKLTVSFLPTAVVGFGLYGVIKNVFFESFTAQMAILALVGAVFLGVEKIVAKKLTRTVKDLSWGEVVLIGLVQALAVFPGVSRAGAVIVGMMMMGVRREEAAKYSFLLAVPTLVVAAGWDLVKSGSLFLNQENVGVLLVGLAAAFGSALVAVQWLVGYLEKNRMNVFGWYRLGAAGILVAWVVSHSLV